MISLITQKRFWIRFCLDTETSITPSIRRGLILTNQFSLIGALAMFMSMISMFFTGPQSSSPIIGILFLMLLQVPYLNSRGYYLTSRLLLSIVFPLSIVLISIIAKHLNPHLMNWENYILGQLVLIGMGSIPVLIFSTKERDLLIANLFFHLVLIVGYYHWHQLAGVGIEMVGLTWRYKSMLGIASFVGWGFSVGSIYLMKVQFESGTST